MGTRFNVFSQHSHGCNGYVLVVIVKVVEESVRVTLDAVLVLVPLLVVVVVTSLWLRTVDPSKYGNMMMKHQFWDQFCGKK